MSCDVGEVTKRLENEQSFCRFAYVTAYSPTLLLFHLRHSSFSNPSFASSMSLAIHLRHLASRPCSKGNIVASHLAGPGSISGRVVFLIEIFLQPQGKCQKNLDPIHPRVSLAIIIVNNHSLWVPMTWDVDASRNLMYTTVYSNLIYSFLYFET